MILEDRNAIIRFECIFQKISYIQSKSMTNDENDNDNTNIRDKISLFSDGTRHACPA